MAVSPSFALGEGNRNLFLIGVMAFAPLVLIIMKSKKIYISEISLLLFMLSIIIIPLAYQPQSMRWSTVLYSIMFGLTFLTYSRLLRGKALSIENYLIILTYLIYAYFTVLLIQQLSVLTGLPIFNLSNYNPSEPWKLNSLAAEPSHSGRIVGLLMYCYIIVTEISLKKSYSFSENFNRDKWVWLAFVWTMLTMGSGTAALFIFIIFLKFAKLKQLPMLTVLGIAIFLLADALHIVALERAFNVFMATLTLNSEVIIHADHSASQRIVPMIILAHLIDMSTFNGWFGHGIDHVSTFMSELIPGVPDNFSGGGMLQFFMEYGFVSFALFIYFSLSHTYRKGDYVSLLFWFFLVFLYGINGQIVWLTIILLYTNNFFTKNLK
jgi:hypothetical protein